MREGGRGGAGEREEKETTPIHKACEITKRPLTSCAWFFFLPRMLLPSLPKHPVSRIQDGAACV